MKLAALVLLFPVFALAQPAAYETTCHHADTGEIIGKFIHTTEDGVLKRLGIAKIYPIASPQYAAVQMNGLALQFMWDRGDEYFRYSVTVSSAGSLFWNNSTGQPTPALLLDCSTPKQLTADETISVFDAMVSSLEN